MKKFLAILCTLASVIGALWFCMKFVARLGICKKDRHMVHQWTEVSREEPVTENENELEKTK